MIVTIHLLELVLGAARWATEQSTYPPVVAATRQPA